VNGFYAAFYASGAWFCLDLIQFAPLQGAGILNNGMIM